MSQNPKEHHTTTTSDAARTSSSANVLVVGLIYLSHITYIGHIADNHASVDCVPLMPLLRCVGCIKAGTSPGKTHSAGPACFRKREFQPPLTPNEKPLDEYLDAEKRLIRAPSPAIGTIVGWQLHEPTGSSRHAAPVAVRVGVKQ